MALPRATPPHPWPQGRHSRAHDRGGIRLTTSAWLRHEISYFLELYAHWRVSSFAFWRCLAESSENLAHARCPGCGGQPACDSPGVGPSTSSATSDNASARYSARPSERERCAQRPGPRSRRWSKRTASRPRPERARRSRASALRRVRQTQPPSSVVVRCEKESLSDSLPRRLIVYYCILLNSICIISDA
jgi:hypothetical protein